MANVNFTSAGDAHSPGVTTVTWTPLTATNTAGTAWQSNSGDRSVQVTGTFDSATVPIQGSNDGTNYATLTDIDGNALSFTAAGIAQVGAFTKYIRPGAVTGAGGSTSLTITMTERGG